MWEEVAITHESGRSPGAPCPLSSPATERRHLPSPPRTGKGLPVRHFRGWNAEATDYTYNCGNATRARPRPWKIGGRRDFQEMRGARVAAAPGRGSSRWRPAPPPRGRRRSRAAARELGDGLGLAAGCSRAVQRYFGIVAGARIAQSKWFLGRSFHPPVWSELRLHCICCQVGGPTYWRLRVPGTPWKAGVPPS